LDLLGYDLVMALLEMTKSSLNIREATEADLPAILEIYSQPELDAGNPLGLEDALLKFRRFATYPNYKLYVAELDGSTVGTFALLIMDNLAHRGASSGVIEDVGVLPEYQGRGIGKQMMQRAQELCANAGCYKVALTSNLRRTKTHAFYESLGFEKHGFSFVVTMREP
jgi:ribosomal protein S18 acetylase RimI-like enzyme